MLDPGESETISHWLDLLKVEVDSAKESAKAATNWLGRLFPFARDAQSVSMNDAADSLAAVYNGYRAQFQFLLTTPDEQHEEAIVLVEMIKRTKNNGTPASIQDLANAINPTDFAARVAAQTQKTLQDWLDGTAQKVKAVLIYILWGAALYFLIVIAPTINALSKGFSKKARS